MFTAYDKAIAGGAVSLIVSWLSHYGLTLSPVVHDATGSLALAVTTYLVGHVAVYVTKNKLA